MGTCLRCGADSRGGLCAAHAAVLARCDDITAEQILAPSVEAPSVWLIDQWGSARGLGDTEIVGRSHEDCSLSILHHSVSAIHAQLAVVEGRLRVADRGSLNGTYVNDERVRVGMSGEGDVLRFGEVCFFVATGEPASRQQRGAGRTVPSKAEDVAFRARVQAGTHELELVQRVGGGLIRGAEASIELARLEFDLLRLLALRMRERRDPQLSFVSARELADGLDFNSRDADSDNVRELVRRVRKKLRQAGVPELIESRQRVGYRLAWPVKR